MTEKQNQSGEAEGILPRWVYLYLIWLIILMWIGSFKVIHSLVVLGIGIVPLRIGYALAEVQIFTIVDNPNPEQMAKDEIKEVLRKMGKSFWSVTLGVHVFLLFIYVLILSYWTK